MTDGSCIIALLDNSNPCHGSTLSHSVADLAEAQREVLFWRSGLKEKLDSNELSIDLGSSKVCDYHFKKLLTYYEKKQKHCCNPFNAHSNAAGKKKAKGHMTIQLEIAKQLLLTTPVSTTIIPGNKVCNKCWQDIQAVLSNPAGNVSLPLSDQSSDDFQSPDEEYDSSLNASLQSCGVSPFKSKGLRPSQKSTSANKKMERVTAHLHAAFEEQGVTLPPTNPLSCNLDDCRAKSAAKDDQDALMQGLRIKFEEATSFADKVSLLTLKPDSWTHNQTISFFQNGITKHMIRTAKKLKETSGLLSRPTRKTRSDKIKPETLQAAKDFFYDDENSRIMPGKKDYVSVSYKVHEQKRLLLSTLSELYEKYKEKHSEDDELVGFTMFCSLRPKCCKIVGSPGGHSVCVCAVHQNAVLAANACGLQRFDGQGCL